jgi:hypothetical protein
MKTHYYVFLLLLFISCCSSNKEISSKDGESLLNYNIILGEGGGFTGNQDGYYIDTLGVVKSFSGITFSKSKMNYIGQLSITQIIEINDLFKTIKNKKYNQNGNMTSYLVLTRNNDELRFSWENTVPDKKALPELVNFYQKVTDIIIRLNKETRLQNE